MHAKKLSIEKLIIISIVIVSLLAIVIMYMIAGPGWDLIVHMLNAKSMLNPGLYQCMLNPGCGIVNGQRSFYYSTYFEPERAPMSSIILMPLYLIFGNWSTLAYALLVFSLYLAAIYYIARDFGINPIVAYVAMAGPYFILFLLVNGAELLSLAFIALALAFLSRRSAYSGLFLGLAFISKYTTLLFLPMLLLLIKPKRIVLAGALALAPSLLWILFQYVFMHGALASYTLSMLLAGYNYTHTGLSLMYLMVVVGYPLAIIAAALVLLRKRIRSLFRGLGIKFENWLRRIKAIRTDDSALRAAIVVLFLILAAVEYVLLVNAAPFVQARLGYPLAFALSLLAAVLFMYALQNKNHATKIEIGTGIAFVLFLVLCCVFFAANANAIKVYSVRNADISNAATKLSELGYGGCRIISNDWTYMLYYGVNAFPQYYPNSTNIRYPIIVFFNESALTDPSSIQGISSSSVIYSSKNFSIMLPKGYECYR